MEKTISQPKQRLFDPSQIPDDFLGVKLSIEIKEKLSYGEESPKLENLKMEDGSLKDAKIKFTVDKEGALKTHFEFKYEKLEIPEKILDKTLTEEEKKNLLANKSIGPIKLHNQQEIYLKVDQELNKVVIKTANEVGIPNKIGGYELNDVDKNKLANGEKMGTKVLEGKDGYFLADIKLTEDKKGMEFSNMKTISKEEAMVLMEKLNKVEKANHVENVLASIQEPEAKKNQIENIISTFSESTKELDKKATVGQEHKEVVVDNRLAIEMDDAIKALNHTKIKMLIDQKVQPTEEQIKGIQTSQDITLKDKNILFTILSTKQPEKHVEWFQEAKKHIKLESKTLNDREERKEKITEIKTEKPKNKGIEM